MNKIEEIIKNILDYRLNEMGYNDKEDAIVDYCLSACPELEEEYEWDEPEFDF